MKSIQSVRKKKGRDVWPSFRKWPGMLRNRKINRIRARATVPKPRAKYHCRFRLTSRMTTLLTMRNKQNQLLHKHLSPRLLRLQPPVLPGWLWPIRERRLRKRALAIRSRPKSKRWQPKYMMPARMLLLMTGQPIWMTKLPALTLMKMMRWKLIRLFRLKRRLYL